LLLGLFYGYDNEGLVMVDIAMMIFVLICFLIAFIAGFSELQKIWNRSD
jgi:hypothetical protein